MKILSALIAWALLVGAAAASAADGLIALKSPHGAKETMDRLEGLVKRRGLNVYPEGGTPFMVCAQSVGIDLPLKALVWEDAGKQVWIGYNDPAYLARRHDAAACPVVANLQKALSAIAEAAVAK